MALGKVGDYWNEHKKRWCSSENELIEMLDGMEKYDREHEVLTEGSIALGMAKAGCAGRRLIDLPQWLQARVLQYAREEFS